MAYTVQIKRSAEKELDALDSKLRNRIALRLLSLEENPRPRGTKKLTADQKYRLRVGDYRVLYVVDDSQQVVRIVAVGHRRDVYR